MLEKVCPEIALSKIKRLLRDMLPLGDQVE